MFLSESFVEDKVESLGWRNLNTQHEIQKASVNTCTFCREGT